MEEIRIDTEYIKLGALLKLAGLASSGVEAKIFILNEEVLYNGKVETRRGKKVYDGDTIEFNGEKIIVKSNVH